MRDFLLRSFPPLLLAALCACTQKNTADEPTSVADVPIGLERFLLFPNPIAQSAGGFETDTTAYADAYYRAIDPNNLKDTLDKWKTANSFGSGNEHLVVFRDTKDLGYGRRMTGRLNTDGSVAFFVENYNVAPGGSTQYSSELNVDAAIRRDTQWHVGTNAIEWSASACIAGEDAAGCSSTARFAKFYNFSSADGTRQLSVDLDGKGKKAMPGPCITCHGGRGDPLTPGEGSPAKPRFPLVENSVSRKRGDVQARLHGMNVGSFGYSTQAGFTRADQEAKLKDFNQWILCTYPLAGAAAGAEDTCRVPAGANEWQGTGPGTASDVIKAWYGGTGMAMTMFSDNPPYVPSGWSGNPSLYTNVVAPFCRTCHILRGTANESDLDFSSLAKFQSHADRIKTHVFDRGTMPLALIVYDDFWRSSAPQTLATYIDSVLGAQTATSASGAALKPGRPIADPGPNRMVRTNANAILTAENSLFASTFSWTMVSGSATIANANGMIAIFNAGVAGTYVVRLTVGNGASTVSKDVTITVDDNFPDPLNIRFAQVKNVLQNVVHATGQKCTGCHITTAITPIPPIFYNAFDRNGSGVVDATDDAWFLKVASGRVNLTEIEASTLLRKPSGNHHNGGQLFNLATTAGLRNYSMVYNWILAGMQPGGVAASALVNGGNLGSPTPVALTFIGAPPFSAAIPVDGSASVGATSYLWSVSGPTGPTGTFASFANPVSATTALSLPNVGSYVVQLEVDDGVSSDTTQQTITVSETPVAADFTPGAVGPPVNQSVSFSGTPLRGNVTLTSSSSGSPPNCQWQVTGPGGGTLDGVATPAAVTKSCGSPALLNVPLSSVGGTYVVTLTATSSLGTSVSAVTHSLTVTSAGSGVVANAGANSTNVLTFTNPVVIAGTPSSSGIPVAPAISLIGSASTGPGTLSYTWSVISAPSNATGAYVPTIASPSSVSTTLTVHRAGIYTVQLFVSNGLPPGPSNTATRTITVNVPATATLTSMVGTFSSRGCTAAGCHQSGSVNPPSWVNETVNGLTLFQRVSARVGLTGLDDPTTSLLITCPAEGCAMGPQPGFNGGDTSSYTQFLNWIIGGALNN